MGKIDLYNSAYLEGKIFRDSCNKNTNKEYNKFKNISFEQKNRISIISTNFMESNPNDKLLPNRYLNCLNYISTKYGKEKIIFTREEFTIKSPTYDEIMTFIITGCDPECELFTTYISCDKKLSHEEKANIARNKLGFFSDRVLKAEKDYYFKFINKLLTNVTIDSTNYITLLASSIKNFDEIDNEKFEDIRKKSLLFSYGIDDNNRYTTCIYDIIHQSKLLNLNTLQEKLVFFISTVDPELKFLEIYEEECKAEIIKYRAFIELGFGNNTILKLEKLYKQKFLDKTNNKRLIKK